ncbi:MAG: hypothetical protein JJE16_01200 [Nitrospiraceae bacterium]|nr:hypothetical protein [Nitrospiraceae bacterium]
MRWRTYFVFGGVMITCLSAVSVFLGTDCKEFQVVILTAILGIIGSGVYAITRLINKRVSDENAFSCCFTDHGPPEEHEISPLDFYSIPKGEKPHYLKIVCKHVYPIGACSIRFITKEEVSKRKGETPENIKSDICITEIEKVLPIDIFLPTHTIAKIDNQIGGWAISFSPPITPGKGKSIFLKMRVLANKVGWSGKISFEGFDNTNAPLYARADARIVDSLSVATPYYVSVKPSWTTGSALKQS